MTFKLVLTFNAIVAAAFAIMFVALPEQSFAMYGATDLSDAAITNGRWFGSAIVGYAVLSWLARGLAPSEARDTIALGLVAAWAASLAMALYAVLTGRVNALGWSSVAIDVVFIILIGMHARTATASTAPAA